MLRFKDVLFLTSAAQDGLSPVLSAPCEQEKASFVRSLKALHCGYLILFRINIGGDFRWLRFVERPSMFCSRSPIAGRHGRLQADANSVVSVCSRRFAFLGG